MTFTYPPIQKIIKMSKINGIKILKLQIFQIILIYLKYQQLIIYLILVNQMKM